MAENIDQMHESSVLPGGNPEQDPIQDPKQDPNKILRAMAGQNHYRILIGSY